jgi:hypothetical protein
MTRDAAVQHVFAQLQMDFREPHRNATPPGPAWLLVRRSMIWAKKA